MHSFDDDAARPALLPASRGGRVDEVPDATAAGDVDLPAANWLAFEHAPSCSAFQRVLAVTIVPLGVGVKLVVDPLTLAGDLVA